MSNQIVKDLLGPARFSTLIPTAVHLEKGIQHVLKTTHGVSVFPRPLLQKSQQCGRRKTQPFLDFRLRNDSGMFLVKPSVCTHLHFQVFLKSASTFGFKATASKIAQDQGVIVFPQEGPQQLREFPAAVMVSVGNDSGFDLLETSFPEPGEQLLEHRFVSSVCHNHDQFRGALHCSASTQDAGCVKL